MKSKSTSAAEGELRSLKDLATEMACDSLVAKSLVRRCRNLRGLQCFVV
jgi:hypothetical protein